MNPSSPRRRQGGGRLFQSPLGEFFDIWQGSKQPIDEWIRQGSNIAKDYEGRRGNEALRAFSRVTQSCIHRMIDLPVIDGQSAKFVVVVQPIIGRYVGYVAIAGQHTLLAAITLGPDKQLVLNRVLYWISLCQSGVDHGEPVFIDIKGDVLA